MRAEYLRQTIALLERARRTNDPRAASELIKQAADMLTQIAELSAPSNREAKALARAAEDR